MKLGQTTRIRPVCIVNNSVSEGTVSGEAVIYNTNKSIEPISDFYVHHANCTTAYTADKVTRVKTATDGYSREAYFTFNLSDYQRYPQN